MLRSCLQKAFYQKGTHSFQKEAKLRVKMYSWPIQDLSRHGASLLKKIKADFTQSRWRTSSTKHFTFQGTVRWLCPGSALCDPPLLLLLLLLLEHTHTHTLSHWQTETLRSLSKSLKPVYWSKWVILVQSGPHTLWAPTCWGSVLHKILNLR